MALIIYSIYSHTLITPNRPPLILKSGEGRRQVFLHRGQLAPGSLLGHPYKLELASLMYNNITTETHGIKLLSESFWDDSQEKWSGHGHHVQNKQTSHRTCHDFIFQLNQLNCLLKLNISYFHLIWWVHWISVLWPLCLGADRTGLLNSCSGMCMIGLQGSVVINYRSPCKPDKANKKRRTKIKLPYK